jgi:hypothetical protein
MITQSITAEQQQQSNAKSITMQPQSNKKSSQAKSFNRNI